MPVGLHRLMMQTQVTRISIQRLVDPVEHSESVVSLLTFRRTLLFAFSISLLGCCGVLSQHPS
uniref:Putative ovule protein n=1 Tax=Solanum chacoense TaxID=4108 RepID=A0A0V0I5S4_SOLCH